MWPKDIRPWRKWHRWIGAVAAIFFMSTGVTGIWLECVRFFGEEEQLRETLREKVSRVSTQTPSAEFAASLSSALQSAAVRAGAQPLDKIVWQMKGDSPTISFYFGKTDTLRPRRLDVDANTGAVQKEADYEDDSLILRLHSGEAFGDGGMLVGIAWGLALIVMTLTGLVIYWRMRKPGATGLRRVFFTLALACLLYGRAQADSPFVTDDPEFSPGWEIKLGMAAERNSGGATWTAPVLDLNYAVVPNLRLNLTLAGRTVTPDDGKAETGIADTELKVKWRFIDADPDTWRPSVGIAPKVFFPTADEGRGLGDGIWRAQLPLQFGKTVGHFYDFAEVGYQHAFDDNLDDVMYYGVGILYSFNPHIALGTEIFGTMPTKHKEDHQLLTSLGAVYTFSKNFSLKASISHVLRGESRGGPSPGGVFYLVWNF
jgi:hypothetical protein